MKKNRGQIMKERYGEDYYSKIGKKGGKEASARGTNPVFDKETAQWMGSRGGKSSVKRHGSNLPHIKGRGKES